MYGGLISMWVCLIIVGAFMPFIPYMTRKTENFGVSIPESMHERKDFYHMRKQYTVYLLILFIFLMILSGVLTFLFPLKISTLLLSVTLFLYLAASFLLYLKYYANMKTIKEKEKWQQNGPQTIVVDTTFRNEKLIHSNWWFLVPAVLILVTVSFTFYQYDAIPDQIPMHTDVAGEVTYDEKSVINLLFMPGTQVFMLALFILINLVIKHSKQQVSAADPERSKLQNIMFRRRWSVYTIVTCVLTVLLLSYIQFSFIYPALESYTDVIITLFIVLILLGTILLSVKTGQGGSRIHIDGTEGNGKVDRDDDRYWKLGQFYVNKNDPSVFIEKRFGIGWTNNWAHPLSWVFIIGIIILPLITVWIFI